MNKFNTWAEETAVWLEESIPMKRLFIPLLAMIENAHETAKWGEKLQLRSVTDNNQFL